MVIDLFGVVVLVVVVVVVVVVVLVVVVVVVSRSGRGLSRYSINHVFCLIAKSRLLLNSAKTILFLPFRLLTAKQMLLSILLLII
jgi:hypothetical protein